MQDPDAFPSAMDVVGVMAVPVLLYHSVALPGRSAADHWQVRASDFEQDMAAVAASGRTPMTAGRYAEWILGTGSESPVLVTFDDGYADFADVALPILVRWRLPSTLFVTTGWIGRPGMLSGEGVAELPAAGVEIGGHSVSHPHLDVLGSGRAFAEIVDSRCRLEDLTNGEVHSFAYPHGSHRRRTRELVEQAGYRTAHAVKNALSHRDDDVLAVGRFTVTASTSRVRVRDVLACRGLPLAWRRERWRTSGYRLVRWMRR
jgi:peptidoglycan/xylan/chitin deacetylase (PgdA/CDA1 family)